MAMLDGKEYASWDEYFGEKFPADLLLVDREEQLMAAPMRVRSRVIDCETQLLIEFPGENTCMVSCTNPASLLVTTLTPDVLTATFFESFYEFNDLSLDQLDNQLNIPLLFGWTDQLVFYKAKLIEAQVVFHDRAASHSLPVEKNRTWLDKAGCLLTLIGWPVLYIQHQLLLFFYRRNIRKVNQQEGIHPPMLPS